MRSYSYDQKCFDLAQYFYPHVPEIRLQELAQQFQDAAEDFIQEPVPAQETCACKPGQEESCQVVACPRHRTIAGSPGTKQSPPARCACTWYDTRGVHASDCPAANR